MGDGEEKFKSLNYKKEALRLVELQNKQLSDMRTNLAGAKEEGFKISTDRAIKNVLKKMPDITVESIAELLEVDTKQVERVKNEQTNLKEN